MNNIRCSVQNNPPEIPDWEEDDSEYENPEFDDDVETDDWEDDTESDKE